jgi:hypothetical protein
MTRNPNADTRTGKATQYFVYKFAIEYKHVQSKYHIIYDKKVVKQI